MYNFFTSVVTVGILIFLAIYNTDFIQVVTLGGTVLGSAVIAAGGALAFVLLRRVIHGLLLRRAFLLAICSFIVTDTVQYMPGWRMNEGVGTLIFLLILCAGIAALNEAIFKKETSL